MFAQKQYESLASKIDNENSRMENKVVPEAIKKALAENKKDVRRIVEQTIRENLEAVKADPSIIGK